MEPVLHLNEYNKKVKIDRKKLGGSKAMLNQFSRTQLLVGREGMERLYHARVAVFGIGGVGGYTVERCRPFCAGRR